MNLKVLNSEIDSSVNFVEQQLTGFIESRYVRKCDEYFIAYLSSQTGCNRGCKFCHLTTTGQTSFVDSTPKDFMAQAIQIFKHYNRQKTPAKYCHYNFMARGEPLANETILNDGDRLLTTLGNIAKDEGLPSKFNISTILPLTLKKSLIEVFNYTNPTIYYSLYSTDESWRKKWIPGAMNIKESLNILLEYQKFSKKIIKIHFPFIKNENDSEEHVSDMCNMINNTGLMCEFNLVRYNPASSEQGEESSSEVIKRNLSIIEREFHFCTKIQVIPRVGIDVKASCGLFISGNETASMNGS